MQNTSQSLVNILSSSTRDFVPVDLIEFYDPSTTELVPGLASKRFANTALVWYGWEYEQQAVSRGSTARYIDERFNTVSLTFSNVDRSLSEWLSSVSVAGYRVLIRAVSRSVTGDSIVLFIGRVEKAFSVTNTSVSLTIKQDLGSINSELPARKFSHACPLKFKGKDCLGGQAITAKTQRYQNAQTCDKSWQQCRTYGNSIFFQGFRTNNVTGSFVLRDKSSLGLPTKSTKQWSSQDATPINEHVPMGLGRTQIELTPIASADTGQFVYGHWVAGEGPITKFKNVRNVTPGFARRFEGQNENGEPSGTGSYREHLGNYGNVTGQQSASDFLGTVHYSGRAYIEGTIRGQNPDTGDPAPSIVSTVLWNPIPTAQGSTKYEDANPDWSDNPVDHVRYILTHERGLQYPVAMVNDEVAIETAKYCDEPLYDKSGGEDLVVGQTDDVTYGSFTAGRFRSTGLIDPFFWRRRISSSAPYSAERLANITYFPVTEFVVDEFGQQVEQLVPPPDNFVPNEYFRKRYTANWHLRKGVKVADFLFKQLLPSFQGYLVTGADGRLQIRSQRSAVQSRSSGTVTPAMNTVDVYDGKQFIDLNLPVKYVLIQTPGFPQDGNIRQIVGIDYLTAANAITIGPPSSGAASMNCRIWGADSNTQAATTFSGGSTQYQAFAYIMVTSGLTQNATAGVRIDGVDVGAGGPVGDTAGYSNNWSAEIAAMIATNLNANPNLRNAAGVPLRDYIEAIWEPSNPLMVLFRSKQATLILDKPFDGTFPINALVTHFHLPFSDGSDERPSAILKDTFEWPLGGRQSTYNQFSITYQDSVQDSQSINVLENDYDHQEATNQINKLDVPGGECVDNYHQADRLLLAARYKYREGDFFVQFQTAGLAMLLEEGDLILVNHSSMPSFKNYLYRIEELSVSQDHRVTITARLYADTQYPEQPVPKTIPLTRSNDWQTAVVPSVSSFSVERVPNSANTARVTIDFPETVAPVTVRVLVRRLNVEVNPPVFIDLDFVDTGVVVIPDSDNTGQFELVGITPGSQIQFVPVTSTGIEGIASIFSVPNLPNDTIIGNTVNASVTNADVNAISRNQYNLDLSGLTYFRDFVLPVPSAVGEEIQLSITAGDTSTTSTNYELIIRSQYSSTSSAWVTIAEQQAGLGVNSIHLGDNYVRPSTFNIFRNGDPVRVTGTSLPGGLSSTSVYYVRDLNQQGGLTITAVDTATDTLTCNGHGFVNGSEVIFSGSGLTGISFVTLSGSTITMVPFPTVYYVRDATANTFKIAATSGGAAIDIGGTLPSPSTVLVYSLYGEFKLTTTKGTSSGDAALGSAVDITSAGSGVQIVPLEWSRLFITGETVKFRSNSITSWQIESDGRIPSSCRITETTGSGTTYAANAGTAVVLPNVLFDNAALAALGVSFFGLTLDTIRIRRKNKYMWSASLRVGFLLAERASFVLNDTIFNRNRRLQTIEISSNNAAFGIGMAVITEWQHGINSYLTFFHNASTNMTSNILTPAHMAVVEIL